MENTVAFQDLLSLRQLESSNHKSTGLNTIAWVIGVVVVLAILAFFWRHNSTVHTATAGELGFVRGELQSLVPTLVRIEGQMYNNQGSLSSLNTHQADFERFYFNYGGGPVYGHGCGNGCGHGRGYDNGHKKFNEKQTYTLASQEVVVDDTCVC